MDFGKITLELLKGFGTTLELFALTLVLAIPLGLLVCFCSMSKFKPLSYFTRILIWIVRGTPLILQLFVFYLGLPFIGIRIDKTLVAIVAFTINYSAYFSEIFRGGILAVPKGQHEAATVLGLSKPQTFFRVILPQVGKNILQPMSNEIITLVKDTALVTAIAVVEVTQRASEISVFIGNIYPLFYSGVFYLVFNGLLTLLFGYTERKFRYYR